MKEQFIIYFKDMGIHYQAEVKAFDLEGERVYDVYYSVRPKPTPAIRVQVYAGRGVGDATYWRQRLTSAKDELMEPAFIEAIGFAIERTEMFNS